MEELTYARWMDVLLAMDDAVILGKNPNMTLITYQLGITHSHVFNIFHILERKLLITTEKNGRTRYVTLTNNGRSVANYIRNIKKIVGG